MSLFDDEGRGHRDRDEAERRRDEAIEQVSHRPETRPLLEAVYFTACRLDEFTSDDVWSTMGPADVDEGRALGAAMRAGGRAGWMVATDRYRASDRPVCHRNPKRVWRSRIHGQQP